ncbi:G patch domain [Trypanosoma vivax]|uniref:PinX1-related protein 1 n=1 Tax=Trypanosoma vivax (strain Y486) TaxID=1055687 RepID=G0TZ50_TRYVY|nr:hypothetical protein TRVL_04619 [Trypanosoma vivax]KAH8612981.1 G patch domain [Trypanosoma vivax]CCC49253.1 conserved hypothetical protein [Trypanosoma vivax Y486]
MSTDPNGTRWLKSEKNVGRTLLKRGGWTEGAGLGKEKDGVVAPLTVRRKDDVMGVGYTEGVQETWSVQSVGFEDVLKRIKKAAVVVRDDDDDGDGDGDSAGGADDSCRRELGEEQTAKTVAGPSGGRYVGMYAKRHALKTELLQKRDERSATEILGTTSGRPRKHEREALVSEDASTLRSPLLKRLMVRVPQHEPRKIAVVEEEADDCDPNEKKHNTSDQVRVVKPQPRPQKCTGTPFLAAV